MAKDHVRYMVGGRAPLLKDEVIYRFEVSGAPGRAAEIPGGAWRRTGTSRCSTTGIMAPTTDASWRESKSGRRSAPGSSQALDALGYPYWNESENPASACSSLPSGVMRRRKRRSGRLAR